MNAETEERDEGFVIDNDRKADWAIRQLKEAWAERSRLMDIAIAERADLNKRIEFVKKAYENRTTYLKSLLQGYFMSVEPSKTTKTQTQYQLLSGKLVMKKQHPLYERDETALLSWAETTAPEYVRVEKKVSWADLKEQADVSGKSLLLDGEVIPGVTVIEREDVFEVQYE